MKDFKRLKVWEKSHHLTLKIYQATGSFPKNELYGIISQIRRAVVSIPTNIAEGCGRNSDIELARFLEISMGSASEVEYLLLLSYDLELLDSEYFQTVTNEVIEIKQMLATLIKKLRADR
jgi:four helix bundle protein